MERIKNIRRVVEHTSRPSKPTDATNRLVGAIVEARPCVGGLIKGEGLKGEGPELRQLPMDFLDLECARQSEAEYCWSL